MFLMSFANDAVLFCESDTKESCKIWDLGDETVQNKETWNYNKSSFQMKITWFNILSNRYANGDRVF